MPLLNALNNYLYHGYDGRYVTPDNCLIYSESAQLQTAKQNKEKEITELKKDKVLLENQLEMEKMKVEAEKKKVLLAHEQLREKVRKSEYNCNNELSIVCSCRYWHR